MINANRCISKKSNIYILLSFTSNLDWMYLTCKKYFNHATYYNTMSYVCARKSCGKEVSKKELNALPGIKCSHCGFRILYKKRPEIIRRLKVQ